jgi:putative ABC transport system permease protein
MHGVWTQFRRAPGRIVASVFALALAVGAIGVLAIPTVSEGTLHAAVEDEGLADIVVPTTPIGSEQIDQIRRLPGVSAAEGEVDIAVDMSTVPGAGDSGRLVGLETGRSMDRLSIDTGRDIAGPGEAVTAAELGAIGDRIEIEGVALTIVGHGSTLWWSGEDDVVLTDLDSARALAPEQGANQLVVTADDDSEESLRAISDQVRTLLALDGDTFTEFPQYMPDGSTPIDADIQQVSSLIGLLGVAAGVVALVLLASTASTLITERTREVAVMRALGGRQRPLRRRLRRIALSITAAGLLIGLPLGVVISNLIARMVLEEFVGVTPDLAVDWRVLVGSTIGMLLGARIVAARAARRVTRQPLAAALRDRDGAPFGRSALQRSFARVPTGGLLSRVASRASIRRPGRTVAVVAQIATAVGAAFLVVSLVDSVNAYNTAAYEPWSWEHRAVADDPGLPYEESIVDGRSDAESGIWVFGEVDDWEVEAYGLSQQTSMFDPQLRAGRWIGASAREAVVSAGFAEREGIELGDELTLELASGQARYEVVGLADDHVRAVYVDRHDLASDLGAPGMANAVWSMAPVDDLAWPVSTSVDSAADIAAEDAAGRDAIVVIFGAIGVIVAGVAALAVVSSMSVSLYERRHEMATMQAMGARRRRLRGLLVRELIVVGALGVAGGLALGALGTRGIIASFEASNAVDIGVVDAVDVIPIIIVATAVSLVLLATAVVRGAARRPVAVTLRGAA